MESADIISPPKCSQQQSASDDLPEAVCPPKTMAFFTLFILSYRQKV